MSTDHVPGTSGPQDVARMKANEGVYPGRERLRQAEARYQRASLRAEQAREKRNAAVREALDAAWTHAQIAEATGLTRGRIGQIAMRSE